MRVRAWAGWPFAWDVSFCPPSFGNQRLVLICFLDLLLSIVSSLVLSLFPASSVSPLSLPTGTLLSMGFGFVEYKKPESAQKALRRLQVSLSIVDPVFFPEMVGKDISGSSQSK